MTSKDPYPGLRPQRPVRVATRPTPWPMIVGIGVLALLVGVVLAIVLGDDGDRGVGASPDGSPSTSASASGSASESASPSSSASASASASGTPAAAPPQLEPDTIAAATVDGLSVRSGPGRDAERLGSLSAGNESFVVEGPTEADGLAWYLVSNLGLPPNSGCAVQQLETDPYNCPAWFGWVAAASEEGEPWLEPRAQDCPSEPLTAEAVILARTDLQRLACFGATPFTFRAWLPEIPEDAAPPAGGQSGPCAAADRPSGWLLCQNVNFNYVTLNDTEGFGGVGVQVSINPASGVVMPERDTWVEVRVHLDDAAAQGCADGADAVYEDPIPEQAILNCRAEMVLEAVTVVDGP